MHRKQDCPRKPWRKAVGYASALLLVALALSGHATAQDPCVPPNDPAGAPDAPLNVTATVDGDDVTIAWDASTETDLGYYAVRRGTQLDTNTGTWTRLPGDHTSTSVVDPDRPAGTVYYFVTAVDTEDPALVSDRSTVAQATIAAPAPTPTPTPEPPPPALWGTDFESGAFEAYKATIRKDGAGNNATRAITSEQARTGTKSAKIVMPASTSSSGVARYQMLANIPNGGEGTDRWYGWSVMLGADWAGSGCTLTQLTDNGSYFMGQGGFRYVMPEPNPNGPGANPGLDGNMPGRWSLGLNLSNSVGGDDDEQRDLGPLCEGVWKDFVIHVKWSSGSDGVFDTYADGVKVGTTYAGRTLGIAGGVFEHRMGLYQGSAVNHARTLYLDNHRVGTSYAAVDPSH